MLFLNGFRITMIQRIKKLVISVHLLELAAALDAASSFRDVKAVVSRGGRTDLVDKKTLEDVKCPCLFIVGGNDKKLIEINKRTIDQLTNVVVKELKVIEGASHLFEEEGKIEEVGNVGARWLKRYDEIVTNLG